MLDLFRHEVADRLSQLHKAANGAGRYIQRDPLDIIDRMTRTVGEPLFPFVIAEIMEYVQRERRTYGEHHRSGTFHNDNIAEGENRPVTAPGADVQEGVAP